MAVHDTRKQARVSIKARGGRALRAGVSPGRTLRRGVSRPLTLFD
jgi:hypothetical protein